MKKTDCPDLSLHAKPNIHPSAFIAKGAVVIGNVILEEDVSIWYNAVLRGDINKIHIGKRSNIQDGCILHLENDRPCIVGDDVTVGHGAILHGCTIESQVLIGMGAIVLNGAVVKKGAVIAAGAVVKENMIVEENTLVAGVPAKVVKTVSDTTTTHTEWAKKYVQLSQYHKQLAANDNL